ncbi:hypothetical protein IEQ_04951 [Bacillus cereus BAG6X1-2]|nr:hypothetical protein IEQ_04951 [Bacillus cereus BAG6X1-2]
MMPPMVALLGFMIGFIRFWRVERKKKKYMQQRKQSFAR